MGNYHLFYRGWTKEALNGKTYQRWVHSACCSCREDMQDTVLDANCWMLPDTDYLWSQMKAGYWGHDDGTPVTFDELMGAGF